MKTVVEPANKLAALAALDEAELDRAVGGATAAATLKTASPKRLPGNEHEIEYDIVAAK